jgi:hypothetical protein
MTTTIVLLFIALASVGVGYGLWSKTLYIDGTVNTGSVNSVFVDPFTDDDDVMNNDAKDIGDIGKCDKYMYGGSGSCDPAASGHNVLRKDKDVGYCFAELDVNDPQILNITIENSYPSYYCTVFFHIVNTGTVPVKIQSLGLKGPDITAGYITAEWTEIKVGDQIDPGEGFMVQGDIDLHVEQAAPQGETLELKGTIQLVQWNEYVPLSWDTCTPGPAPCVQAPKIAFDGNTVIMGVLGEGDTSQPESAHGGSALLPEGSSYDVTFQYHVCTWDSYNAVGTGGYADTGYWDSFSVSTSPTQYWNLNLTDPLDTDPDIKDSLGFLWGGDRYADNILRCTDGTETVNLPGFDTGTYLNVMLDTGTDPQSNGAHPSFGTITVEKIVVNP